MRRTRAFFVLSILTLPGCKMSAVNMNLTVFPDHSGRLTVTRVTVPADQPPLLDAVQGLEERAGVAVDISSALFHKLEELEIGGITGSLKETEDGYLVSLRIPTTARSRWYQDMGLSAEDVERLQAWAKRMRELEGKESPPEGITLETLSQMQLERAAFVFQLDLPGVVRESRLRDKELPPGWLLAPAAGEDGTRTREAYLAIPLADILKGAVSEVMWEVGCGPLNEAGQKEWDKVKRQLEEAAGKR